MKYELTKPCPHCPFRNDRPGYLTTERAREIANALDRGYFPCHATLIYDEDENGDDDIRETDKTQHCAGAMIMLEHMERPSQLMRIAERLGLYDMRKLVMDSPVVKSAREFVRLHSDIRR